MHSFRISSDLCAPPEVVWRQVTKLDGVNDELRPLVRMTAPPGLRDARIDDLTIAQHGPGHRFREESRMLTQSRWEHQRDVVAIEGGCRVVDSLNWQGRVAPLGALFALAVPILFQHRHRRLRHRFGELPR